MISENCDIDEFVEAARNKDILEVIALAIDEATAAERIFYHTHRHTEKDRLCGEQYSRQLKQLINYLRFEIKPRRPKSRAYQLYMANWGGEDSGLPSSVCIPL
ncbi:hypothetical protein [Desulfosarcina ovata]|uniref:Uncharacterized protein n=1 Tax=Desulfosarcina ovata subsp. ovata TaxID=2752305 RepID=A0A5K8AKC0_9BACT|nr:hypothetical protein [Desulfosarcina ovata]BBO93038.1 hypothetical protein DSCOOX_62180 [Desulfosarcina ovata subsp. ovata]